MSIDKITCHNGSNQILPRGEFHPPGFLGKFYWDENDDDYRVYCTSAVHIPSPGIKRGMSIWGNVNQHNYYEKYNTVLASDDPTIGWFHTWNLGPTRNVFRIKFQ